jgi:murein DD-endopeptidase MepM/ murein hydrolase activator NlpD
MKRLVFLVLFFLPVLAAAKELSPVFFNAGPLQGETAVFRFKDADPAGGEALFDGKSVPFFRYGNEAVVLIGIPATKPAGHYPLKVNFKNGDTFSGTMTVGTKRFRKITLGIPGKLNLTPTNLVAKVGEEKVMLDKILNVRTPEIFFTGPFGLPLFDNRWVTDPFGTVHQTGGSQIRHLGIDIAALKGTPIGAMNDGVVRKAYFDSVYGNSVVLDHGQGIFTLYLHLNRIRVREGEILKKGTVLGTVGETGYATGPHLHLSVKIGGNSVDPVVFAGILK